MRCSYERINIFNGEFVEPGAKVISIDDRGYLFGDSVYEVVRVTKGRCFALSYHQDRLYRSMREMDIPVKMTPDDLTELHEILMNKVKSRKVTFIYKSPVVWRHVIMRTIALNLNHKCSCPFIISIWMQ